MTCRERRPTGGFRSDKTALLTGQKNLSQSRTCDDAIQTLIKARPFV